jgi:hypothetical protein
VASCFRDYFCYTLGSVFAITSCFGDYFCYTLGFKEYLCCGELL